MKQLINRVNNNPTALTLTWNVSNKAYQVTEKLAKIRLYYYGKRANTETGEIIPHNADVFIPVEFVQDLHSADLVRVECSMSTRAREVFIKEGRKHKNIIINEPLFILKTLSFVSEKRSNAPVELITLAARAKAKEVEAKAKEKASA